MRNFASIVALLSVVALAQEDAFEREINANYFRPEVEANGDTSDSKRTFEEICVENGF